MKRPEGSRHCFSARFIELQIICPGEISIALVKSISYCDFSICRDLRDISKKYVRRTACGGISNYIQFNIRYCGVWFILFGYDDLGSEGFVVLAYAKCNVFRGL